MAVYQLSNYLFRCEPHSFLGVGGCAAEIVIEQATDIPAAAERARADEWYVFKPSPFDDSYTWDALCPSCAKEWHKRRDAYREKEAASRG